MYFRKKKNPNIDKEMTTNIVPIAIPIFLSVVAGDAFPLEVDVWVGNEFGRVLAFEGLVSGSAVLEIVGFIIVSLVAFVDKLGIDDVWLIDEKYEVQSVCEFVRGTGVGSGGVEEFWNMVEKLGELEVPGMVAGNGVNSTDGVDTEAVAIVNSSGVVELLLDGRAGSTDGSVDIVFADRMVTNC